MLTRWGRDLDPDDPLPDYPRPQLVRPHWVNLNGPWECAFTRSPERPASFEHRIVVPFSPEAPLSGVGRQLQPDEWLWYRRRFTAPGTPPGGRVLLHFGAVDQSCTVFVNGHEAGGHVGGYLPFTLDITGVLAGGGDELLEVRVRDPSESAAHARGKQRLDRGRIWYTAQSGIWQTVWLEPVPATYVEDLLVVPDLRTDTFEVTVAVAVDHEVEVAVGDHTVRGTTNAPVRVTVPGARRWSPEDPQLHGVRVRLADDRVTSYAAMRSFGTATDPDGHPRLLLNGEPRQHVGLLDQGYWPDGLLTPPSDAAMVHDIETAKRLGFTMLRKHVKVEPLRWYHHCDRLGMLVWQDMVNGGRRYRHLVTGLPATRPVRLSDRRYGLFGREDAEARSEFRDEVRRTVRLLRSAPCVVVWTPFNEGWGQFDAALVAAEVAILDPTRPVNHVSGWIDQGGGDIRSHHCYVRRWRVPRGARRDSRVLALTEYGGYDLRVPDHVWGDGEDAGHGYRSFTSREELAQAFVDLHHDVVGPTVAQGLAATVYTQLTDVEDELNGLLTYDREVLKIPAETVRSALAHLR
ncbi:MAG: glycoside hydrolase family 2 protein [Marmoricola sp.]